MFRDVPLFLGTSAVSSDSISMYIGFKSEAAHFAGNGSMFRPVAISTALSLQSRFSFFFYYQKGIFMMGNSILNEAALEENWQNFLIYKLERQHLSLPEENCIRDFIARKAYLPLCDAWKHGQFPSQFPLKQTINKEGTQKKRIVYSFPGDEGIFLKFIAFHLFRYDDFFAQNCYAFRRDFGVRDAFARIRQMKTLSDMYCLKVDVSNYFNSIDVDILLSRLHFIREHDASLYLLFERILKENRVMENGHLVSERHGAMAGTPISPFFANVYLTETDRFFAKEEVPYFRYSDDILIFANSMEELLYRQKQLYEQLSHLKLTLNPDKVCISAPGETWEFLGFCYRHGDIDLSANTIRKTKAKIKRKADALRRWQRKKKLSPDKAAIGLIRAMNRKFYGTSACTSQTSAPPGALSHSTQTGTLSDEFTWSRWFFPILTVDTGLHEIDTYLQEYIRYAVTGRHYKGNYRISYEQLKDWGYRSLVHEYYAKR